MTHDLGAPAPAALVVEQLDVRYRGSGASVHAVQGVDLCVGPGEVVAVVGESGSGKSSICHSLLGLTGTRAAVSADRLEVGGRDLRTASARTWQAVRRDDISFVPQQPMTALSPTVSVGRQLDWHLGAGAVDAHRDDLLALGLHAVVERPGDLPSSFSGGQLQRVVIAIATLRGSPKVLIADEPTSTLDATVAAAVVEVLLARQRALGAGMLYVSHDLATVAQLAQRVVVMEAGRAVESGTVDDVFGRPQHRYTAALLEAIPRPRPRPVVRATAAAAAEPAVEPTATSAGEPRLRVDHVYRYFGRDASPGRGGPPVVRAVDDVSLSVPRGSVTALVGESGSGKSTLARVIAGSDAATAGDVLLDGAILPIDRSLAQRRAVQLVSQNHRAAFNRQRSVRHALLQVQRVHGLGHDRHDRTGTAIALLARVGLTEAHLRRRPRELSGGEAARMALARSLLLQPEVLVLDEPTAGLDARVRATVIDLLRGLRDELGLTVLLITHEIPVAGALADRVAVMHQGQLQEEGPADQVLHEPAHAYTRALLASVPPDPRRTAPA